MLDVLDVGCGVSPLLFALAEGNRLRVALAQQLQCVCLTASLAAHPGGWGDLHGVDFAAGAIQFCSAAAAKQSHAGLRFTVGDALALDTCVPDESADVVVDNGCLDCFVTGDGEANVAAYIAQLARIVRKPHGRVIIFAVNGADVPHLLRTGEIQADANCAKGSTSHRQAAWGQAKREKQTAHGQDAAAWVQQLWLVETVACAEKHVLVCATQAPSEANSVPPLRCNECGRRHACGVGPSMPEACPCGCKLRRFALS